MAYKRRTHGKGVPKGYKHVWGYKGVWKEKKVSPTTWKVDFVATKGKKAKGMGNFKKGFKVEWDIKGKQTATKTGKGQYQTRLIATKKLIKTGNKKKNKK